jgi:YidC/Oxa1 family membrane protein insertase
MFSFIVTLYNEIFYYPLLNGLLFLTSALPGMNLGIAVILLTLFIRGLMFPITHKMIKTQHAMKKLEPEMKKIKDGKQNKEDQAKAIMDLYKRHGINPFSGILALLLQFPVLIALYHVFWQGIPFNPEEIYSFLIIPAGINESFFGFFLLTEASVVMAAIAAVSQYIQAKLAILPGSEGGEKKKDFAFMMQKNMVYVFPFIIFIFASRLPAAVSLYWTAMNIFAIVHEAIVRKQGKKLSNVALDERGEEQTTN